MFAQLLVTLLIICSLWWVGKKFLYDPIMEDKKAASTEGAKIIKQDYNALIQIKQELKNKKESLQLRIKEENVNTELNEVEKELEEVNKRLNIR